jgi:hypothetical protein
MKPPACPPFERRVQNNKIKKDATWIPMAVFWDFCTGIYQMLCTLKYCCGYNAELLTMELSTTGEAIE